MNKKELKAIEQINADNLQFVNGGQSISKSRRWDSTSQDSKKHDDYTTSDSYSSL